MELKFKNAPINELVIGVYFSPHLDKLRAEHIGLFWSHIQKKFPRSSNAVPIGGEILGIGPEDIFPLPRFWFISEDNSTLIQIQRNAFLFNWRKREDDYPHYKNVKKEFDENFLEFEIFLKSSLEIDEVYIDSCELSYINTIQESDLYHGISDIKNIIPSFDFPDTGMGVPKSILSRTYYQPTENIRLGITIQDRVLKEKQKEEQSVLYFEMKASGKPPKSNKREADLWFEKAHEVIGECFLKIISPEAKEKWK